MRREATGIVLKGWGFPKWGTHGNRVSRRNRYQTATANRSAHPAYVHASSLVTPPGSVSLRFEN